MKVTHFNGFWTVYDCLQNTKSLFIYGDNDIRSGCGGQAIIRNCPNSIGIPTKKFPNNYLTSFYSDDQLEENKEKINFAISVIIDKAKNYEEIVLPKDGFGTGLSQLPQKAPMTYLYLNEVVKNMILTLLHL